MTELTVKHVARIEGHGDITVARFKLLLLEELVRSYDPCLSCSVH